MFPLTPDQHHWLEVATEDEGWPRRNFVKMFDAGKARMIGLPYGEKIMMIC